MIIPVKIEIQFAYLCGFGMTVVKSNNENKISILLSVFPNF